MATPTTLLDHAQPEVRIESAIARAEVAQRSATVAFAEQLAAILALLGEARVYPETYVGHAFAAAPDAPEFAVRAAIADLAVRLGLAERTVRQHAHEAETLLHRTPRVWAAFREGDVPVANARTIADLLTTLDPSAWASFESAVLDLAMSLAPARFRARARVIRERVEPKPLAERHRVRADERRVWLEPDVDGMAWLTAYLPADRARFAMARLDRMAESLAAEPSETRTVGQLRADIVGDLLAGVPGTPQAVGVTVAVTVPVLTLLDRGDAPGTLEGYGPIDVETARRLTAHAPSFRRILTDPISGTILDVDRRHYRPPADLARFVRLRDQVCTFVGCGRAAASCDLDHTVAWADGGTTSAANLAAVCRDHHRLKHRSNWKVENRAGVMHWTSPTGYTHTADPPPF